MTLQKLSGARLVAGALVIGAVVVAAGCQRVTYGTGRGTTAQTVTDLTTIFAIRGANCRIPYQPRPDLVIPPTNELPPPGTNPPPPECAPRTPEPQ